MTASEGGAVLVVEGDWDVVHTYRRWLEGTHAIREASDGGMALDQFDEDVDADWDVVHTYRRWLEGTHAIREASDGGMALDQFDEDVDADHLVDDSRFVATPLGGADARR